VWAVLRRHPRQVLRGALVGWGPNSCFYFVAVFLGSFLPTERMLPLPSALGLETASIAFMLVLTLLAGALADRFGRRVLVLVGSAGCGLVVFPLLIIARGGDPTPDLVSQFVFSTFVVTALVPYQVWLTEQFPRSLRASGLGLAYNGAAGILGGSAPLVCTTLAELTGSALAPAGYIAFACLMTLTVAARIPETGDRPLA
jgi:MHS family proline/betaine transporter-like MFS transporter